MTKSEAQISVSVYSYDGAFLPPKEEKLKKSLDFSVANSLTRGPYKEDSFCEGIG